MQNIHQEPSFEEKIYLFLESEIASGTGNEVLYSCMVQDNCKMIATSDILPHTIVYQGYPILSYKCDYGSSTAPRLAALNCLSDEALDDLSNKIKNLYPNTAENIVKEIACNYEINLETAEIISQQKEHQIITKIDCNAYGSKERKILYLSASKLNHSCYPNCIWDIVGELLTIRTLRSVKKGDELTHCYYPKCMFEYDAEKRKQITKSEGRFECNCCMCKGNCQIEKITITKGCDNCGKTNLNLMICSSCKASRFCSKECQRILWSKHKKVCRKTKPKFCYCPTCLIESKTDKIYSNRHPKCHFK